MTNIGIVQIVSVFLKKNLAQKKLDIEYKHKTFS